jgi:HlyD family secretion protein
MTMRFIQRLARRPREVGLTSASLAAIVMTAAHAWPGRPASSTPTALVTEGPFRETLLERGAIDSAHLMLYGSTIAGAQAKILEIVPEGTAVQPGQVLVRFDPAPFELAVAQAASAVAQDEAQLLGAREDLRQEQVRAEGDVDAARQQIGFAERALSNERDGKGPVAMAEATAAANDAARDLTRARATVDDMHALFTQGFVTRVEVERAEQTLQQADDRQRVASLKLKTLQTFEQPAAIDRSRAEVAAAAKNLNGATESAQSKLAQRQAVAALLQTRLGEDRQRLAHARDQVDRAVIRSEAAGLVVYRELFFGTEKRKPQPGDEVWPNQPIVAVPDPDQLVVQTRVREIDLHRLSPTARVMVSVDAYPDLTLPAAVTLVGALAQEDATRAGPRFFPVTVKLLRADGRLRTGMTARVEIEVSALATAVVVPVQALIDDHGVTRCAIVTRTGTELRTVEILARNELVAAVRSGLRPGETVLLGDPTQSAAPDHDRQ